jgi:hypothetical protein
MREFTDDLSIQYERFPGKSFKKRNERSALNFYQSVYETLIPTAYNFHPTVLSNPKRNSSLHLILNVASIFL